MYASAGDVFGQKSTSTVLVTYFLLNYKRRMMGYKIRLIGLLADILYRCHNHTVILV